MITEDDTRRSADLDLAPDAQAKDDITVVLELVSGTPPYADLSDAQALHRIVHDEAVPLPAGLSAALVDFLGQCLTKDPSKRPSAESLKKGIRSGMIR